MQCDCPLPPLACGEQSRVRSSVCVCCALFSQVASKGVMVFSKGIGCGCCGVRCSLSYPASCGLSRVCSKGAGVGWAVLTRLFPVVWSVGRVVRGTGAAQVLSCTCLCAFALFLGVDLCLVPQGDPPPGLCLSTVQACALHFFVYWSCLVFGL